MRSSTLKLLDKLASKHSLTHEEYVHILENRNREAHFYASFMAEKLRRDYYDRDVYIRGLIEVGNVCSNDCYYCGIRKSNGMCERYILSDEAILECCRKGYEEGFRTFVLQSGEGSFDTEEICRLISGIKESFPDCAVTLSLGECTPGEYGRMFDAGADRYLLRHETADENHYRFLHPPEMSFENRMRCLRNLKDTGFQVGCGFMVGSPGQTSETLAKDLKFIETFKPDMCGIGPFIPEKDTPFGFRSSGTAEETAYLLALIRLIKPNVLLPVTTALRTLRKDGLALGLRAGANVIMPNLTPQAERSKYTLYDSKVKLEDCGTGQGLAGLKNEVRKLGYQIVTDRGDIKRRR